METGILITVAALLGVAVARLRRRCTPSAPFILPTQNDALDGAGWYARGD